MISFPNHGDVAEDAELILFFQGGSYRYPVHLKANESLSIDIASSIHSSVPDHDGHVIPGNITEGSARFISAHGARKPTNIKAHAAVFNVQTATCMEPCNSCSDIVHIFINPGSASTGIGENLPFQTTVTDKTGNSYDVTPSSTWSSSNTSTATVASNGVATGVNLGSANITAQYIDSGVPSWNEDGLCRYPVPQCPRFLGRPSAPVQVAPIIISIAVTGQLSPNDQLSFNNGTTCNGAGLGAVSCNTFLGVKVELHIKVPDNNQKWTVTQSVVRGFEAGRTRNISTGALLGFSSGIPASPDNPAQNNVQQPAAEQTFTTSTLPVSQGSLALQRSLIQELIKLTFRLQSAVMQTPPCARVFYGMRRFM